MCNHFGHPPSVNVFLHFFKAKRPGKNLWVSFSGVEGRVLLTLFEQSYKGFKGKLFRVCRTAHDPTLLDGFPIYWVRELKLKKPKTLEELASPDREVCQVLASLGVVFNTAQLIKHVFSPSSLKGYIGSSLLPSSLHCVCMLSFYYVCMFCFFILVHLLTSCTLMTILLSSHDFLSWCRHGT